MYCVCVCPDPAYLQKFFYGDDVPAAGEGVVPRGGRAGLGPLAPVWPLPAARPGQLPCPAAPRGALATTGPVQEDRGAHVVRPGHLALQPVHPGVCM